MLPLEQNRNPREVDWDTTTRPRWYIQRSSDVVFRVTTVVGGGCSTFLGRLAMVIGIEGAGSFLVWLSSLTGNGLGGLFSRFIPTNRTCLLSLLLMRDGFHWDRGSLRLT